MTLALPFLLEPTELEALLGAPGLVVVDLSRASVHQQLHVPGAVHLEYGHIVAERLPASGLVPEPWVLEQALSLLGIDNQTHVVAYDDEGGGKAGRLIWTLHHLGHPHASLLNGGLHAWANEGHRLSRDPARPEPARFAPAPDGRCVADADWIRDHLDDPGVRLIDARSLDEYLGRRRFALRGGHIPGARHWEWTAAMDNQRNLRLRPRAELERTLAELEIERGHEVVVYCQTHHRSSFTYAVLKALGFERVRGYPGSWSDWGNRPDTPVETG